MYVPGPSVHVREGNTWPAAFEQHNLWSKDERPVISARLALTKHETTGPRAAEQNESK